MRDFTLNKFEELIKVLKDKGYAFQPYKEYILSPLERVIVLRHDVDLLPLNSLATAEVENRLGIKGVYYFRSVPESYDVDVIKKIDRRGHEVGFHYETMDIVIINYKLKIKNYENKNEILRSAFDEFKSQLMRFNEIVEVKTVCMHGSPRGKYDNKLIWSKYNYKDLGIIGEPYLDIDWNEFGYLTDTGRRWNGDKYSLRDKVNSKYRFNFKSTDDIINNVDKLPDKLMITVHPQRWTNNPLLWTKELVWQNVKNVVKFIKVKKSLSSL